MKKVDLATPKADLTDFSAVLERVDIQDSHGLATLIQAPFGRRLG
jgi:hypothetical protein